MTRRELGVGIALILAGGGLLLSFVGAMIEGGFGMVPLGEATLAVGLITMFICVGIAGILCLVGLIKEWIGAR